MVILVALAALILTAPVPIRKEIIIDIKPLNYSEQEKIKLSIAVDLLSKIVNSEEYKQRVIHTNFPETRFDGYGVYHRVMSCRELSSFEDDNAMSFYVSMYNRENDIIGWTTFDANIVYTNRYYHSWYTPCQVAANLMHEWMHQLGFDHDDSKDWDIKGKTVPYAHNDIVMELCYLAEYNDLTPILDK